MARAGIAPSAARAGAHLPPAKRKTPLCAAHIAPPVGGADNEAPAGSRPARAPRRPPPPAGEGKAAFWRRAQPPSPARGDRARNHGAKKEIGRWRFPPPPAVARADEAEVG